MNNRIGLIVTMVVCLGLGVGLVVLQKRSTEQHQVDTQNIHQYSNRVVVVTDQLERQKQVNSIYEKDLDTQKKAFSELTNNYTALSANLAQVSGTLTQTEEALKTSQQEVTKRDTRISELEAQNHALDNQALELSTTITNLSLEIAETQRKLAASEGDKSFLENQLKRLMAEKAELENQFNDLTVLRAQVAKIKRDRAIARRIEWMRQGLAGADQKGAQKLMQGLQVAQSKTTTPGADLNVEAAADGSVKVIPGAQSSSTNAPSAN